MYAIWYNEHDHQVRMQKLSSGYDVPDAGFGVSFEAQMTRQNVFCCYDEVLTDLQRKGKDMKLHSNIS